MPFAQCVDDLIRELRPLDDSWKWTRAENLHITLKFLGEVAIDKVPSAIEILRNVPAEFSIPLKFHSLGFFPNERRPRVLWVGMDAPQSLSKLAMVLDESLAQLGVAHEGRDFSPHLTLARWEERKTLARASRGYRKARFARVRRDERYIISLDGEQTKIHGRGVHYARIVSRRT